MHTVYRLDFPLIPYAVTSEIFNVHGKKGVRDGERTY
jgi:hypothetical protein